MAGVLSLVLLSLIWGLTFPLIRIAVKDITPELFVFFRFLIAVLLLVPLNLFSKTARSKLRAAVKPGLILGVVVSVGYLTQTIGLMTVPSPRAAFITGLSVLLVPFLAPFFGKSYPTIVDWVSAFIALVGLFFFLEPHAGALYSGDVWILICALAAAIHIHLVQRFTLIKVDESALVFSKSWE